MHENLETTSRPTPTTASDERCARCGHTQARHSGRKGFLNDSTPGVLLKGYAVTLHTCNALGGFVD